MAKVNPVKVKQDADKEEKAGRLDKAVLLYRQLLDDNPRDWNTINKIGDLYAKMNRNHEAALEYAKVADFYAKDGFHLKAIAIWKKINKLDATALDPYLSLADLYAKQGLMMEAKSQYQIVVDEYMKRGKGRDAGEVLRKMADIDPADLKIRSKLADLYTRDGNTQKAIEEMIAIAEELNRKGHLAEAVQVLEKGLKIDAKSQRLRGELARCYIVQKNFVKAAEFLEDVLKTAPNDKELLAQLGEAYLSSNRLGDAEKVFKRLVELNPDNPETRIQMARLLLAKGKTDAAYDELLPVIDRLVERNEGEKAATLLQHVVQKAPGHVKTLSKLVELYRKQKNDRAVISTYSQITEAYIKEGQLEQAASVLEILISLEPGSQQHQSKLQLVKSKLQGGKAPVVAEPAVEEDFDLGASSESLSFSEDAPAVDQRRGSPPAAVEASGPLSEEDKEFIDEHLAEGKVFRKYGLIDKAADQFEAVVARFPDHLETRTELLDVYKEKGHNGKVAEQALAIAQIQRMAGDVEATEAAIAEARSFDASVVPADWDAPTGASAVAEEPATSEEDLPVAEAEEDIPLEVEEGGLEASAFDLEAPSLDLGDASLETEASSAGLEAPAEDAPVDFGLSGADLGFDAAPPEPPPEPEPAPPVVAAPLKAAPQKVEAPVAAAPATQGLPVDLQRVLDEVGSYMSLGFVDDAKDALREIGQRYPGHPAILQKIAELGIDPEAVDEIQPEPAIAAPLADDLGLDLEPPPAEASPLDALADLASPEAPSWSEPAAPEPEDGGIDLGAELGELFSAQSAGEESALAPGSDLGDAGLSEMFKEFKKGVDKQLGKEDYDTRYNLGIAYKEMGLVDEAIAEFQLAAKDENRMLECSSMLGICFMDKGMPKLAVKWFEKGLKAPGRSDEEYQGLRYDLAMAHEASGEVEKALNIFEDLYGQDTNFRDVAQKVRDLRAAAS